MNKKANKRKNFTDDPNEDTRLKGTYWNYWNSKERRYDGPEIRGSVLAYQAWSRKMKDGKKLMGVLA